ncbi:MAG: MFS transporter [Clostridiales bacterium]|nr:MFS transporter [Clostridiales bacterium]
MKNFKKTLPLYGANALVYGLNALYYCFIQIYISNYHPDDITGILLAIGPFVSIFAPILWGLLADRARSKNLVLAASVAGSAIFYYLLGIGHSFWYLAIMLTLVMFFMSPFGGLIDIITLEYTTENDTPYGPIRICGTFMFGLLPMLLTGFTENNISLIFYVYLVMAALAIITIMLSPRVEGHGSHDKRPSVIPLFRDKKLMLIFLFVGVAQFTWAYYLNYFPNHLTGDLGLSQQVWGINVFVTVLGEIPFFLMFNRLFKRIGIRSLLLISLVLVTLRYAGLAFLTNVPLLLLVGLVTGFAVTVFTYCGSVYITEHVAPESKASANSLMYALGNGIPKVLAGVLGGRMTMSFGYTVSMVICTLLCAMTLVVFFISQKSKATSFDL